MGSCLSVAVAAADSASSVVLSTTKIITVEGGLIEYSLSVNVSDVLGHDCNSSFLCNSDGLCYNEHILPLSSGQNTELGKLYFILPVEMLDHALSGPDMAELAVKAASAISGTGTGKGRRTRGHVEIMPISEGETVDEYMRLNELSVGGLGLKFGGKRMEKAAPLRLARKKLSAIEENC